MIMGVPTPSNRIDYIELSKTVTNCKELKRSKSIEFKTVYEGEVVKSKPSVVPQDPPFITQKVKSGLYGEQIAEHSSENSSYAGGNENDELAYLEGNM